MRVLLVAAVLLSTSAYLVEAEPRDRGAWQHTGRYHNHWSGGGRGPRYAPGNDALSGMIGGAIGSFLWNQFTQPPSPPPPVVVVPQMVAPPGPPDCGPNVPPPCIQY
jgi:hypothetical protein